MTATIREDRTVYKCPECDGQDRVGKSEQCRYCYGTGEAFSHNKPKIEKGPPMSGLDKKFIIFVNHPSGRTLFLHQNGIWYWTATKDGHPTGYHKSREAARRVLRRAMPK